MALNKKTNENNENKDLLEEDPQEKTYTIVIDGEESSLERENLLDESNTNNVNELEQEKISDENSNTQAETTEETKDSTDSTEKELTPLEKLNEKMYLVDLQIEEVEVKLDDLENKLLIDPEDVDTQNAYLEVKKQDKELVKQKKAIQKEINSLDTSTLNKVSIWVVIYGVISIIIAFPLIAGPLWNMAANAVLDLIINSISGVTVDSFLYNVIVFLVIFAFPLILNIVTWTLFVNLVKTKTDKKAYVIMWIIQGVMSLGLIIYMCTKLYA